VVTIRSFYYHLARLIGIPAALEAIEALLAIPEICTEHVRAHAGVKHLWKAVGGKAKAAARHPGFTTIRGRCNGLIEAVNLIIATGQKQTERK